MAVIWTDEALNLIADIYAFIAKDSPYHAGKFTDKLMDSVDNQLSIFPYIGVELSLGNDSNLRVLYFEGYRIIYHVIENDVYIKNVEEGSKLLTQERVYGIKEQVVPTEKKRTNPDKER